MTGERSSAAAPIKPSDGDIRVEISQMMESFRHAKVEIAAIKHPMARGDRLGKASQQLDAIVTATESATNNILRARERIESAVAEHADSLPEDGEAASLAEDIGGQIIKIMEACSFQDLTGQRVTKVFRTVEFIDERIQALIETWGPEAFVALPVVEEPEEDELLQGPALDDDGVSQSDIDALFD